MTRGKALTFTNNQTAIKENNNMTRGKALTFINNQATKEKVKVKDNEKATSKKETKKKMTTSTESEIYKNIKRDTNSENLFDLILFMVQNKELILDDIKEKIDDYYDETAEEAPINNESTSTTTNKNDNKEDIKNSIVNTFTRFLPTKKSLTKRIAKKYISDNLIDVMTKYVDSEYKTIVHKCKHDINKILNEVLDKKIMEQYTSSLVNSSNKLLNAIYTLETDKIIEYINNLNINNNGNLTEEGEKLLRSMVDTVRSGKDKDITKVIDLIMSQIGEFGIFNNIVKLCIKQAGKYHKIDGPILNENITDDQVVEFVNNCYERLNEAELDSDKKIKSIEKIKSEINKAAKKLNDTIDNIGNIPLIQETYDQTQDIYKPNINKDKKIKAIHFDHNILSQPLSAEISIPEEPITEDYYLGNKINYNDLPGKRKNDIKYIKNILHQILDQNIWTKQFKVYALENNIYAIELKRRDNDNRIGHTIYCPRTYAQSQI